MLEVIIIIIVLFLIIGLSFVLFYDNKVDDKIDGINFDDYNPDIKCDIYKERRDKKYTEIKNIKR